MYRTTTSEHVDGPLAGVPFGVKDIIDVRAMPTGYGLEDRPARIALIDAWCVAILRAAGAVPAGKTRSTALASRDPALTRNPRIAGRTPGGSSAGSAAAVAAGHVPFALGTQTMGSVVRPAAFCGVVGFKPSYGRIPVTGVSPLAPSFDTIGVIADGVATATRVAEVLLASPLLAELGPTMRLGWAPSTFAERFSPELLAALDAYVATLERDGLRVERAAFERIDAMRDPISAIMGFEANATLTPFRESGALPPGIEAQLAHGETISYAAYRAALDTRAAIGAEALAELARFDAVLVPIAGDPPTPETTGDAMPQAPWTAWGAPSLALPIGTLPSGAPVAIGIVAQPGRDAVVLEVARRLEGIAGRTVAAR